MQASPTTHTRLQHNHTRLQSNHTSQQFRSGLVFCRYQCKLQGSHQTLPA